MNHYWEDKRYGPLRDECGGNRRLASVIAREGLWSLRDFVKKFTAKDMLRLPQFGPGTLSLVKELCTQNGLELRGLLLLGDKRAKTPYHLTAYGDGGLLADRWCTHWAQVGGIIGNLADDADRITVYRGETGEILLHYDKHGVFLR